MHTFDMLTAQIGHHEPQVPTLQKGCNVGQY